MKFVFNNRIKCYLKTMKHKYYIDKIAWSKNNQ